MRIYRARHLVPMSSPPVEDGAVAVQGDTVAAAGRWADVRREFPTEDTTDLGEVALLPGLINAHCHLDYSGLRHAILPPKNFAEWVGRINALKRTMDADDYLAAIARGFREQARWGTTTILNIESFPELMWKMPAPPLRTWWFYEMIDVRRAIPTEELVAGALLFFQEAAQGHAPVDWLGGTGLSPHAPYTASTDLYRLARRCALANRMPWTTHLGESADEQAMFVRGAARCTISWRASDGPWRIAAWAVPPCGRSPPPIASGRSASPCISTNGNPTISRWSRPVVRWPG